MPSFIELPGDLLINLDHVSTLGVRMITNPTTSYRVEARIDGDMVPLVTDLATPQQAMSVIKVILKACNIAVLTLDPHIGIQNGE